MTLKGLARPRLLIVAGPNGAGKTTVTDSPEINAARVARRMLQGGHEVPIRKILDRWARSIANCAAVAKRVDRLYLYDNSVEDRPAELVLRATSGVMARQYAQERPWMAPIVAQLQPESH